MTYYILQSLLWLLAAFFIGACLGCILKNLFGARSDARPARRPSPGELVTVGTGAAAGVGGATVLARDKLIDERTNEIDRFPQPDYRAEMPAPEPVPEPVGDDLKRIRAIGPDLEARLHDLGVRDYAQIAAWSSDDVKRVSAALTINRRISEENWIEQAAMLARGEATVFSERVERGTYQTIMGAAYDAPYDGDTETVHVSHTPAAPVVSGAADGLGAETGEVEPATDTLRNVLAGAAATTGAGAAISGLAEARSFSDRQVQDSAPRVGDGTEATSATADTSPVADDDLKRIEGIGSSVDQVLRENGVTRYAQIAAWTSADVARFNSLVSARDRVQRENWIEQAAVLAAGGLTTFARRMDGGLAVAPLTQTAVERFDDAVISQDEIEQSVAASRGDDLVGLQDLTALDVPEEVSVPPVSDTVVQLRRASEAQSESAADASGLASVAVPAATVTGLGALLGEARASEEATDNAADAADSISETIRDELEEARVFDGDAPDDDEGDEAQRAEETIEQAEFESRSSGEAVTSTSVSAETQSTAMSASGAAGERDGRERALREREPRDAGAREPHARRVTSSAPDDLKRIRGIGVIVERKLNSMGISRYEQIANWTAQDIEAVNAQLEFMGRIERENWIQQAQVLSRGGNTDFARRVDRGDDGPGRGPRSPRGPRLRST